jgi:hypothetical protein
VTRSVAPIAAETRGLSFPPHPNKQNPTSSIRIINSGAIEGRPIVVQNADSSRLSSPGSTNLSIERKRLIGRNVPLKRELIEQRSLLNPLMPHHDSVPFQRLNQRSSFNATADFFNTIGQKRQSLAVWTISASPPRADICGFGRAVVLARKSRIHQTIQCRFARPARIQKFLFAKIINYAIPNHPDSARGADASSRTRGGMRWTSLMSRDERHERGRTKSCGPGAPGLALSLRVMMRRRR